ncbi:phage tail tape measure protein [Bacteroides caccae]|uniref:phage tail tape measure protein n=1 Tax=Bacteroides caccae TaxID=47678 RepID=UPI003564AA42
MADYKDYIVRYDIQADVTKAAEGLQSIASIAKEFEVPMRELSAAIKQTSQSAFQLKQNANISFAPKIDVGAFNNQLRNMVVQVRSAAAEMHAAIFEALSGNASATKAMQKGIGTALKSNKSISDLKSDIAAYNKELDKLLGTPVTKKGKTTRNRDGAIQMAKNAKMDERVVELEARKKMLQQLIKQRNADLAVAEKLEKEASATTIKTDSKAKQKVTSTGQPKSQTAKLTNVTPSVIREWKKTFGDAKSKSLTINIRGNAGGANGALTVIQQIQASLEALQAKGTFNINPMLNMEAFASAETQLKRLAGLTSSVTAPFIAKDEKAQGSKLGSPVTSLTKNEKSKLSEAKKQVKAWNEKISSVQSRLDANKEKYEQAPTPGLKGQITRDTKTLEKYQANRTIQEDVVKNLQSKTATAVQSSTKGVKPLSIDIIGNLKGINIAGKTPIVPIIGELTKIQGKIAETIPVNVKIMADQVAASIKSIPTPTLNVNVRLNTEGVTQQLQTVVAKPKSVAKPETKTETIPVKGGGTKSKTPVSKNAALITGDVDTKNIINQIKNIPRQTIPIAVKLMWEKGAVGRQEQLKKLVTKIPPVTIALDTKAAIAKFEEFIALIKSNSVQNIRLTASGNATNTTTDTSSTSVISGNGNKNGVNTNTSSKNRELTPQERYAKLKEDAVKRAQKAKAGGNQMLLKGKDVRTKEQAWHAQQQAMYNRLFETVPKPDYGWLKRAEDQRASELATMREDAKAAFAKPTPFERKEMVAHNANVSNSIAGHQQKATRLRSQAYNSMLPFAQNKEQANMMAKHRKYFRQAVSTTGIMPTQGMEAPQMLKYLQGVSSQMQSASVAVPWQLQNQINKLEGQVAKSKGIASSSSAHRISPASINGQKSFFDQSRKWAYPFTGQTSFGARTPMAVDMAKGMGVMFAVGGAMSAIGDSFSQAMEYQNTMRTTQAILQHGTDSYSKSSFKNMEATVRDVGVKTKFSAPEVADAAKFLAMAGYDINAINASIRPIADLALIGDSDLGETADKMTNIMTTFQIAPEKMREAANIMATTATRSNTDLMMLAESAKYGGGVANMYGRNDPNLFADTMALFGVMGNAGVQASSAGTALRMMYQNIFKPNKNQKAVLNMMEKTYGITTIKEDGGYRSMSDILVDMAQRIPENKMAEIVGNLFRITAQPGATATLLAAAGGDTNTAQEIGTGIDAMSNKMSSKAGLSSLVALMLANRASMSGNISGAIAEEKQNTIQGLWAQVTSTFTEGIVQAFEQRQGGFEGILRQLRDYFAKPETMRMMQNLIDMIVEIGKVMAWFAKIWAGLYNMAPGMIKYWVTIQMFFTQMGTLISPIISLIGVFNRLGGSIAKLAGVSLVGSTAMAKITSGKMIAGTAANSTLLGTPFAVGGSKYIYGNAAARANKELASNAVLAGELALSGASKTETLNSLNHGTRQHYAEVRKRASKIYGPSRVWRALKTSATAIPTIATFAPIMGGIQSMLTGLLTALAKALGFLVNPITLTVGALGALGFGVYKLFQFVNGNTEAQILAQQQMAKQSEEAARAMISNSQWYKEQLDKFKNPAQVLESTGKTEKELEYEANAKRFKSEYADIIADLSKNSSYKGIDQQVASWRERVNQNPLYKFAIGKDYDRFVGDGLTKDNSQLQYTGTDADGGIALYNLLFGAKNKAKFVQNNEIQAALRTAGANHPTIQNANEQIANLRQQFFNGVINEDEYYKQAYKIRDSIVNLNDPRLRPSAGMSLEQFNNISDPSIYREYAIGQYNIINSFINGESESLVGKLNAYKTLRNGVEVYSNQWWSAISNVIGDFPLMWNAVSADKKQSAWIELQLSMLPDGKINSNNIIKQIEEKVGSFKGSLQNFANMYAKVYQMMAEAGLVPNTKEDALKWTQKQLLNLPVTPEDAASFYHNNVSDNSVLKKYGATVEEYQKYITNPNGKLTINGKTYYAINDAKYIRNTLANQAVDKILGGVPEFNGKGPLLPGVQNNNNNVNTQTNQTPTPNITSQNEYASKYERSSAKPTQINIHINELAHFDRTTVASSAEERDLVESMESKIAEAVYRIFAEASNHAQKTIDLI